MRSAALLLSAAALLPPLMAPAPVEAQEGAGALTAEIIAAEGLSEDRSGTPTVSQLALNGGAPFSIDECNDGVLTWRIGGLSSINLMDLWSGNACNTVANRQTLSRTCLPLSSAVVAAGGNLTVDAMASQVEDITTPLSALLDCGQGSPTTLNLWMLGAIDNFETVLDVGTSFINVEIGFDLGRPAPPTDVVATSGGSSGTVTWSQVELRASYQVFVDDTACPGGVPADAIDFANATQIDTGGTSAQIRFQDTFPDLAPGEFLGVAVGSVDDAGNESEGLSAIQCIERLDTDTFLDAYCAEVGDPDCTQSCAVTSSRMPGASFALLLATLLAVRLRRKLR
jgi:hypothetical protein